MKFGMMSSKELYSACRTVIGLEDKFIKLAFDLGTLKGYLQKRCAITYAIQQIEINAIELKPIYDINGNSLLWLDGTLNGVEHTNFFENGVTEYSCAAAQGAWEEAFAKDDANKRALISLFALPAIIWLVDIYTWNLRKRC